MGWNYRRCKQTQHYKGTSEVYYGVHEVYFNDSDDSIHSITEESMSIVGETEEELNDAIEMFSKAFTKPIIDMDTIKYAERQPVTEPNAETIAAMKETESGIGLTTYDSVDELFDSLKDIGC